VIEQFLTDTAREADIILPAKSMFEQTDIINGYWHPYILLRQKILDCPGEVKPETEIYYLLAKKMGFSDKDLEGIIPVPGDKNIDDFLEARLNNFPEISINKLKQKPILAPQYQDIVYSDFKFNTPSKKIELFSKQTAELWKLNPLPVFTETKESIHTTNNKYPLFLMTPNSKDSIHSQFINLKTIREINPEPVLLINPKDAQKRKIKHNNMLKIYNSRGYFYAKANIDLSIKEACVSIINGWQSAEAAINNCSMARETDMGFGSAFHDNAVEIKNT